MDLRTFISQLFTPGTVPCTIFGAVLGIVFAILCMTIGVGKAIVIAVFCLIGTFLGGVRDKKTFLQNIVMLFHRHDEDY